jgi:hypothetical protein
MAGLAREIAFTAYGNRLGEANSSRAPYRHQL